jgi:hypothetical protein
VEVDGDAKGLLVNLVAVALSQPVGLPPPPKMRSGYPPEPLGVLRTSSGPNVVMNVKPSDHDVAVSVDANP